MLVFVSGIKWGEKKLSGNKFLVDELKKYFDIKFEELARSLPPPTTRSELAEAVKFKKDPTANESAIAIPPEITFRGFWTSLKRYKIENVNQIEIYQCTTVRSGGYSSNDLGTLRFRQVTLDMNDPDTVFQLFRRRHGAWKSKKIVEEKQLIPLHTGPVIPTQNENDFDERLASIKSQYQLLKEKLDDCFRDSPEDYAVTLTRVDNFVRIRLWSPCLNELRDEQERRTRDLLDLPEQLKVLRETGKREYQHLEHDIDAQQRDYHRRILTDSIKRVAKYCTTHSVEPVEAEQFFPARVVAEIFHYTTPMDKCKSLYFYRCNSHWYSTDDVQVREWPWVNEKGNSISESYMWFMRSEVYNCHITPLTKLVLQPQSLYREPWAGENRQEMLEMGA